MALENTSTCMSRKKISDSDSDPNLFMGRMDPKLKAIESARTAMTTAASVAAVAASAVLVQTLTNEARKFAKFAFNSLRSHFSSQHTIVVHQRTDKFSMNPIYNAVKSYLATKIPTSLPRVKVGKKKVEHGSEFTLSLEPGQEMVDVFQGVHFRWTLLINREEEESGDVHSMEKRSGRSGQNSRKYELKFKKRYKKLVLESYLPYILERYEEIKAADRTIKLYMNGCSEWNQIDLNHPATFDTLAMDPEMKRWVMDDLTRFLGRKDYYKKIGKAWKRGYLLHGPPGTGKSSLVAAMANYLRFNIYDLELTNVKSNDQLRRLLFRTTNRSIILVEDIDCSVQVQGREVMDYDSDDSSSPSEAKREGDTKVTLSGILNFVDGLWSSFGEERVFVFTTNYKNRLDPALLRPGRMDVHINMSYCKMSGFRLLASNYHDVDEHPLLREIEGMLDEVDVTPAEVTEKLMADNWEVAVRSLIEFIQKKKKRSIGRSEVKDVIKIE